MTIPSVLVVAMVRDAAEGGAVVVAFLAVMVLVLVTGAAYCHRKGRQCNGVAVVAVCSSWRIDAIEGPGTLSLMVSCFLPMPLSSRLAFSLCFFARIPRTPKGYCVRVLSFFPQPAPG